MAGTKIGAKKAAAKNLAKNENFYKELGARGGKAPHPNGWHGFTGDKEKARLAGIKGAQKRWGAKKDV